MPGKRIVFSTNTANDQGFIIPNDVLDFTRYDKNPVLLKQHNWESDPLGRMTDIDYNNGEWTGVPVFHRSTPESIIASDLWEGGFLTACSIGGFKTLKTTGKTTRDKDGNQVPEVWTDKDGLAVATHFEIYEISMVSIPSNPDAVQKAELSSKQNADLNAKIYDDINIKILEKQLTTLSTKLKNMDEQEKEAAKLAAEKVERETAEAKVAADKLTADKKKADDLPKPIDTIVEADEKTKEKSGLASTIAEMFNNAMAALKGTNMNDAAPKGETLTPPVLKNLYETEDSKVAKEKLYQANDLQEKVGTMTAKAKEAEKALKAVKLESAKLTATQLMADALEAKEKADKPDASEVDKDEFKAKKEKAEEAVELCSELEADMDEDDMSDEMKAAKKKEKEKEKLAAKLAASKPRLKTMDELKADGVKLAAKPNLSNQVTFTGGMKKTMSQLKADPQGQRLIERVQNRVEDTAPQEYAAYMSAWRNEPKVKPVFDKARIILGATENNWQSFRQNSRSNPGESVDQLISRLAGGNINWLDRNDGNVKTRTTLTATDNFLASPDLFAMDFLDLAIFQLFRDGSWKNDIPIFGADSTENNTGLIWANINSNPTIYRGSQPVNPASQQFTDLAVSLNLTPYFMNPVIWTPITMAQLRYNQMDTQWAQNFAVMGQYIDDFLLYTLAASVPHSSIFYSSGVSVSPNGGFTTPQQTVFNGNPDNPYGFFYSPFFQGSLNNPTLNDILLSQLIYSKQNFILENEKPVMVLESNAYTLIQQTGQAQSLLTRWIDANGQDQLGFSHTRFTQRSAVAAFNPQTAQVLSPTSIIPSVATGANLGFIPSQVGIGIANLDVFMIQDPSSYGYKASADVRMGITPLRQNGNGVSLYAWGPQAVS